MAHLCIDIGGTNTLLGIGNGSFDRKQTLPTSQFLDAMETTIDQTLADTDYTRNDIESVKVAAAGPVETQGTPVFYPPNIEAEQVSLEPLTSLGRFKLYNDCHAAAMGEYHASETDGRLIYITVSTGIGAGIVDNGTLQTGGGNAGEIGHIPTGHDSIACGCGGTDHWEAHCGGAKIPHVAETLYDVSVSDARALFEAYRNDDPTVEPVVQHIRDHTDRGLATTINAYDPEIIRIGGGIGSNHFDILFDRIEDRIEDEIMGSAPRIEPAALGEESVLQGLASLN